MQLTDHQTQTIINALRAAAELYQRDAELNTGDERIVAQFRKQTIEAEDLAVFLEEARERTTVRQGLDSQVRELRAELEHARRVSDRDVARYHADLRRIQDAVMGVPPVASMTVDELVDRVETLRGSPATPDAQRAKDPLVAFLEGLTWDGAPRCDSWLATYWGAEDTEENRKIGRSWLLEAVARAFRPGVAGGRVFVPYGPNRSVMHAMILTLAPRDEWASYIGEMHLFGDDLSRYPSHQWMVALDPTLLCWPDSFARLRDLLSSSTVRVRPFYGTHEVEHKLRAVYACALSLENSRNLLNRARFLQVRAEALGALQPDRLRQDVGQLWAEAVHLYRSGALAEIP